MTGLPGLANNDFEKMKQRIIDGDSLRFREYFTSGKQIVRFHSVGKAFLYSSLKTTFVLVYFFLLSMAYAYFSKMLPERLHDFLLGYLVFSSIIYFCIWSLTFYHSFVLPRILAGRILSFLRIYLPDAEVIDRKWVDTFLIRWRDNALLIAYKENVEMVRERKKVTKYIKIAAACSSDDKGERLRTATVMEEEIADGIRLVQTEDDAYVTCTKGQRLYRKDVVTALEKMVRLFRPLRIETAGYDLR